MTSLRNRLFVILVAATCLIWLCAIFWVYLGSKTEFERALDNRLREAAKMVVSLVADNAFISNEAVSSVSTAPTYERQLSCQIWSLDGRLIAHSSGTPKDRLAIGAAGFSERVIDGEAWRVYSVEDREKGVRVMVGDRVGMRNHLVHDLVAGLVIPALLALPALGLALWFSLDFELRPLRTIAKQLRHRPCGDMTPFDVRNARSEIKPLIEALNDLMANLEAALRHDRELTAFAAHEMRTPIAGLKTQTQIAITTSDPAVREVALGQILISVDRTTRLIRQLLTLTKLDADVESDRRDHVNVGDILDEIIGASPQEDDRVAIYVDPALRQMNIESNREILTVALRNLHENALQHMPGSGVISWRAENDPCGIAIEDEGPGIPDDELPMASRRFFRGRHKSATGTGLGLAIVELAATRLGGRLNLANRKDGSGLKASLCLKIPMEPAK